MKFVLTQHISEVSKVGVLVVRGIDTTIARDETYQALWQEFEKASKRFTAEKLHEIRSVADWREAFKRVGLDGTDDEASHIALLKRTAERRDLPSVNPLVNILNACSLKFMTPIGGHDLDKISGDITVGPNTKSLPFSSRDEKKQEVTVPESEPVYADSTHVLTRKWVWRQGTTSLVTEETRDVFIPIDVLLKTTDAELTKIVETVAGMISQFLSTSETSFSWAIASKDHPKLDLDQMRSFSPKKTSIKTYPVNHDPDIIARLTERGVEHIYPSQEDLVRWLTSGRRLTIYQGFDPTADTLHIGHTVGMRKLRDFQKLGHHVVFLIGSFTGRVGDPTDKATARKQLTRQQVEENYRVFEEQASRIIDLRDKKNPVTVVHNAEWLEKLGFAEIVDIASVFTVQQMIKRDMFQRRLKDDQPIFMHEFLYPLMQAYDSQHLQADVEVGGNDQTFNMLAGRDLTMKWHNREKVVISCKLLVDPGGAKMGKSEGNMVMLSDTPEEMFGKIMSFTDPMIVSGFEILTDIPLDQIQTMQREMSDGSLNPMDAKKRLAFTITQEHKGTAAAQKAQQHFETLFQKKDAVSAETVPTVEVGSSSVKLVELLVSHARFTDSNSRAKRLIEQGAVSIDGNKVTDKTSVLPIGPDGFILRAGRRTAHITR
ncbi:MAG: tyrosine--tRNA ligase [Candidatus Dojkabacteria bacterium]|nr:tyrosine--tRNA ligase [Candidatus Dojkabacteria bacterium]